MPLIQFLVCPASLRLVAFPVNLSGNRHGDSVNSDLGDSEVSSKAVAGAGGRRWQAAAVAGSWCHGNLGLVTVLLRRSITQNPGRHYRAKPSSRRDSPGSGHLHGDSDPVTYCPTDHIML